LGRDPLYPAYPARLSTCLVTFSDVRWWPYRTPRPQLPCMADPGLFFPQLAWSSSQRVELSMSQLLAYRVAVRAAQFAIAAAGILFLLLLFSRQAHAATGDEKPGALQSVTSAASALTGPGSTGTAGA